MSPKTALVIRATGSQGKATTEHLLKAGWTVHALVRDPSDIRALNLKIMGAELHKGEINDIPSVESAIAGCSAVFLNQMPSLTDIEEETRQAGELLDAAKKAGVNFIVHATTLPLNDPNHAEKVGKSVVATAVLGKGKVEQLVKASGIPFTIIRPGYFMTNFIAPLVGYMFPTIRSGVFLSSFDPTTVLPLVAPNDIGALAVAAFEDPRRFNGQALALAGENLGLHDIATALSAVAGKDLKVDFRSKEDTAKESATNPIIAGQLVSVGLEGLWDAEEVKTWGIPLTTFREFLEKNKDAVMA
ncbi:putative NAD dependent epimerase/dehydratase [Pleomassaria siparia CBS 279.74]|uniref:Putative NAD dependent epimerase/dehydratase n=1 Tax=Pleomassaria siparia CBS 279.74 TaxID=1314801 RepID=A0A6G1KJ08_9PLEO|nr:putative NAD dependent epimerase/dehydratase [Pleomassaria siparia CBS 279.74]